MRNELVIDASGAASISIPVAALRPDVNQALQSGDLIPECNVDVAGIDKPDPLQIILGSITYRRAIGSLVTAIEIVLQARNRRTTGPRWAHLSRSYSTDNTHFMRAITSSVRTRLNNTSTIVISSATPLLRLWPHRPAQRTKHLAVPSRCWHRSAH